MPVIDMQSGHAAREVNGTISFVQANQQVSVEDFNSSDLEISGASLETISENEYGGYTISLLPHRSGIPITVSIRSDAAEGPDGASTGSTAQRFVPIPQVTAQDNLVLWYEFEGNQTTKILDLSSRQADASRFGGELIPGKFSQALSLSRGNYISVPGENISFNQSFTLSIWAKILDDAEGTLVANGQVRLEYHDNLKIHGFARLNDSWAHLSADASPGKWSHYALCRDAENFNLFVNGEKVSSLNVVGYLGWESPDEQDLYLGIPTPFITGMESKVELDSLRIYDRLLTDDEITQIYGYGSGDLGIRPQIVGSSPFASNQVSQKVKFWQNESNISVSGFDLSDINASGATLSDYDADEITYNLTPQSLPSTIRVSIPHGAIVKDGNLSQAGAFEFQHRNITSIEDGLVAWYDFNADSGSSIIDRSGNLRNGMYRAPDVSISDNSRIQTSETSSTSYPKSNAFDNNTAGSNDKWLADWNGSFVSIQYNFDSATEISSYAVYSQNADEEIKSPQAWTLHGSNNNSYWILLDTVTRQKNWGEWEKRTFPLAQTANHKYYRLTFTETTGTPLR